MNYELINETIGLIDFDLIEAADEIPQQKKATRVTAFAKPWMKWAVAAILIVVIGVGTPVALNMMGAFKNDDLIAPSRDNSGSGKDNSAVITPVDSSDPDCSSEQSSQDASSSKDGEPSSRSSGRGNAPGGSGQVPQSASSGEPLASDPPGIDSSEPDSSSSFDIENGGGGSGGGGPLSIGSNFGGNFHKKNMPAVTYRINGESKSFDYDHSAWIMIDAESDLDGNEGVYIIDYYSGKDGSSTVAYDGSEELMEYSGRYNDTGSGEEISEEEAAEAAKNVVLNTELPFNTLENLQISRVVSSEKYYRIVMTLAGGNVDVSLNKDGSLAHFLVNRDASVGLSHDRIAVGREKLNAKLEELRSERPTERFVATGVESYQKLANKIYAIYEVIQYPYQDSDLHKRLRFYCVV